MEASNNHFNISLPFSIENYRNNQLLKANNVYHLLIAEKTFNHSKNFVVMISGNNFFNKVSTSFADFLGYTREELLGTPFKSLVINGYYFPKQNKINSYYFENVICCKDSTTKKIKWRLIPDVLDDNVVFVGWEVKKNRHF